jgi:hypothetical protein
MKKKLLLGLAILPFLVGIASAGQPLSDPQMDTVTAGTFPLLPAINLGCGCNIMLLTSLVILPNGEVTPLGPFSSFAPAPEAPLMVFPGGPAASVVILNPM